MSDYLIHHIQYVTLAPHPDSSDFSGLVHLPDSWVPPHSSQVSAKLHRLDVLGTRTYRVRIDPVDLERSASSASSVARTIPKSDPTAKNRCRPILLNRGRTEYAIVE
jgi:hypothetical protein